MSSGTPYRRRVVPDGGWGWVVAAASCVLQFLFIGTCYTFGIIFVDLIHYFRSSQTVTSWIGSLQMALLNITGILAVPVMQRFGWRTTAITGSVLCAVGFGTSAFANNIYILYLTYGVLTGTGCGFIQLVSIVCVQEYFDKHRAVANGIAVAGGGVGITIFGATSSYVIALLGWKTMVWINAGIFLLFGVTAGAMYKPLPYETGEPQHNDEKHLQIRESLSENQEKQEASTAILNETPSTKYETFTTSCDLVVKTCSCRNSVDGITRRHSMHCVQDCRFQQVSTSNTPQDQNYYEKQSLPLLPNENHDPYNSGQTGANKNTCQSCISTMSHLIDWNLFKNPVYCLFTFNILMFQYCNLVPFTFLPELAIVYGAPYSQASLLIPGIGLTSIFSRLSSGWLADRFPDKRFDMVGTVFALLGVLVLLTPCFYSYPLLILYSAIFGIFYGTIFTLFPVILYDLLDPSVYDKALSVVFATMSIACLTAAPLSGLIIDESGSIADIHIPFMVVGGFQIIGALAYFAISFIQDTSHCNCCPCWKPRQTTEACADETVVLVT